jgi:thioredoxin reductase (NADPH)
MSSKVIGIGAETIELETAGGALQLDNDAVIVCAGGILPTELLRSMNIEIVTKRGES